jgi:hypothetical protein
MAGDAISSFAALAPAKSQLEVSAASWTSDIHRIRSPRSTTG